MTGQKYVGRAGASGAGSPQPLSVSLGQGSSLLWEAGPETQGQLRGPRGGMGPASLLAAHTASGGWQQLAGSSVKGADFFAFPPLLPIRHLASRPGSLGPLPTWQWGCRRLGKKAAEKPPDASALGCSPPTPRPRAAKGRAPCPSLQGAPPAHPGALGRALLVPGRSDLLLAPRPPPCHPPAAQASRHASASSFHSPASEESSGGDRNPAGRALRSPLSEFPANPRPPPETHQV